MGTLDADNLTSRTAPVVHGLLGYRAFQVLGVGIEASQFSKSVEDRTYKLTRFMGVLNVYPPGVDWIHLNVGLGQSKYSLGIDGGTIVNEDLGYLLGVEGTYSIKDQATLGPFVQWARHDFGVRGQRAQMLQFGVAARLIIVSPSRRTSSSSRPGRLTFPR